VPNFHSQATGGRFGFHEPAHIVPPGTEPDLQALNNLYIAEKRAKERQAPASQIECSVPAGYSVSDLAHQLPGLPHYSQSSSSRTADHALSRFDQNIDPSLRNAPVSGKAGQNNEVADNSEGKLGPEDPSWEGHYDGSEDNSNSESSGESDEECELRRKQVPAGWICFIFCNHTLTFLRRLQG